MQLDTAEINGALLRLIVAAADFHDHMAPVVRCRPRKLIESTLLPFPQPLFFLIPDGILIRRNDGGTTAVDEYPTAVQPDHPGTEFRRRINLMADQKQCGSISFRE